MEARRGVLYIVRASGRRGRETLAFPMGCCPRTVDGSGFFSIRKEFWVSVRPKAQGRIAHAACRAEWYVSGSAPSEINLRRAKDRISKLAEAAEDRENHGDAKVAVDISQALGRHYLTWRS